MPWRLRYSTLAAQQLVGLDQPSTAVRYKKTLKALGQLQVNPRHPSLKSHRYRSFSGPNGEVVWESYIENRTPGAWRIFWHYGVERQTIIILTIVTHP